MKNKALSKEEFLCKLVVGKNVSEYHDILKVDEYEGRKVLIGTNAHWLHIVNTDTPIPVGTCVNTSFRPTDKRFPNWRMVLRDPIEYNAVLFPEPIMRLYNAINKSVLTHIRLESKNEDLFAVRLDISKEKDYFRDAITFNLEEKIGTCSKDIHVTLDFRYLVEILLLHQSYSIEMSFDRVDTAVIFKSEEVLSIVMPIRER